MSIVEINKKVYEQTGIRQMFMGSLDMSNKMRKGVVMFSKTDYGIDCMKVYKVK